MLDTTGTRLRELRSRVGLSQAELAEAAGLSNGFISLVESGDRTASLESIQALAAALGTTADFLANGQDSAAERRVDACLTRAEAALGDGDSESAKAAIGEVALEDVSHVRRLRYLTTLGRVMDAVGDVEPAIDVFEEAVKLARAEELPRTLAELGMWLAGEYLDAGSLNQAADTGEWILAEVERMGISGTDEHLRLASTLIWVHYVRGNHAYAWYRAKHLMSVADALGSPRGRGSVYWNAALITQAHVSDDEGVKLAKQALECLLEAGSARDVPRLRIDYGMMLVQCAEPRAAEALEQLQLAEGPIRAFGGPVEVATCLAFQARALLLLGHPDEAEDLATQGLAEMGSVTNLGSCEGIMTLGDIAIIRGDLPLAEKRYRWAAERMAMMAAGRMAATAWASLGARFAAVGDVQRAGEAYRSALSDLAVTSSLPQVGPPVPPSTSGAPSPVPVSAA